MNQILNRFYRILKTINLDNTTTYDTDYSEAWDELNDFLKDTESIETKRERDPPEILRNDYRILEVRFGSNFSAVKKSYIHLVKKHHPDQFTHNPSRQNAANEKIKEINVSYQRIRAWETAQSSR